MHDLFACVLDSTLCADIPQERFEVDRRDSMIMRVFELPTHLETLLRVQQ